MRHRPGPASRPGLRVGLFLRDWGPGGLREAGEAEPHWLPSRGAEVASRPAYWDSPHGIDGALPGLLQPPPQVARRGPVAALLVGGPHQLVSLGGLWVSQGVSPLSPGINSREEPCVPSSPTRVLPEAAGHPVPVLPVLLDPSHSVPGSSNTVTHGCPRGSCCVCGPVRVTEGGKGRGWLRDTYVCRGCRQRERGGILVPAHLLPAVGKCFNLSGTQFFHL